MRIKHLPDKEHLKRVMLALLYPRIYIALPVVIVAALSLIGVFSYGLDSHPISYVVYVFSFYALCMVCAHTLRLVQKIRKYLHQNTYTAQYLSDVELRIKISLYTGTLINMAYAIFKLLTGIYYSSIWFGAVAIYYMVLSLIKVLLIRSCRRSEKLSGSAYAYEWKSYRLCGILLLLLNITMTGMAVQMIWHNKTYNYPGSIIYASAAYTFYRMAVAVSTIFGKKISNPILMSAKALDLSMALMAMFALQTAMLVSFGNEIPDTSRQFMNFLTGGAVCLTVLCIAIYMIVKSSKKLQVSTAD